MNGELLALDQDTALSAMFSFSVLVLMVLGFLLPLQPPYKNSVL